MHKMYFESFQDGKAQDKKVVSILPFLFEVSFFSYRFLTASQSEPRTGLAAYLNEILSVGVRPDLSLRRGLWPF